MRFAGRATTATACNPQHPMSLSCVVAALVVLSACSPPVRRTAPVPEPLPPLVAPSPVASSRGGVGPRPPYTGARDPRISEHDLDALWQRQLLVPVDGVARAALRDSFDANRGARAHRALDIMAPHATPVRAADDCVIGRFVEGPVGGIALYATDLTQRFVYYYAHLQRRAPGLAVGDRVARGTLLGYVGSTGNASSSAPHLHFQVMKRGNDPAWWDGIPINPFGLFGVDGGSR